ncbi:Mbov_0399 family ICE element protein [[Mycoplasma] anseris]|nr:hypothetical protein [[Mycoplasma] anseris]
MDKKKIFKKIFIGGGLVGVFGLIGAGIQYAVNKDKNAKVEEEKEEKEEKEKNAKNNEEIKKFQKNSISSFSLLREFEEIPFDSKHKEWVPETIDDSLWENLSEKVIETRKSSYFMISDAKLSDAKNKLIKKIESRIASYNWKRKYGSKAEKEQWRNVKISSDYTISESNSTKPVYCIGINCRGSYEHTKIFSVSWINYKISYEIYKDVYDERGAYDTFKMRFKTAFDKQKTSDNKLILETDYQNEDITNFKINESKYESFESNYEKLSKWFDYNFKSNNLINGWSLKWEINKDNNNAFNVFIQDSNGKIQYIFKNINIKWKPNEKLGILDITDRLVIKPSKYVDFREQSLNNPTALTMDKPTRKPNDSEIKKTGKEIYLGTWIYHAPVSVSFLALTKENEVLEINGTKIDVLNQLFTYTLYDQRKNPNDQEEINVGDKDNPKNVKKNEYTITISVFDNINTDDSYKEKYTYKIIIDSKANAQDYKWYAWNPEKIKTQKDRITKYLTDENDNPIFDEKGNLIPNPKYDPLIDENTGTKKELVWLDFSQLNLKWDQSDFDEYYEKFIEKYKINRIAYPKEKMWNYHKETSLPPFTYNLLHFSNNRLTANDKGVIAEASVLGKGAIKQLVGKTQQYLLFKLDQVKDNKWNLELLDNKVSDYSYFSTTGLYLFVSAPENGISSYKLILIDERNDHNVNNKLFTEIKNDLNYINNLWTTTQGFFFKNFLIKRINLDDSTIEKLNYEELMEYWKAYISFLAYSGEENIIIEPSFNISSLQNKFNNANELREFLSQTYANPNDFIRDFGNGKFINELGIREMNVSDEGLLSFKLYVANPDLRFKLNNIDYQFKINFIDETTQHSNIFIYWNELSFLRIYSQANTNKSFMKLIHDELSQNGFSNFINNNVSDLDKIDVENSLLYLANDQEFNIELKLKETYKANTNLINPFFTFRLNYLNPENEIFNDFEPKKIVLNNINEKDELINTIQNKIVEQITTYNPDLVLNKHYKINLTDELINQILNYKTHDVNTQNPFWLVILPKSPYYAKNKILFPIINLDFYHFEDLHFKDIIFNQSIENLEDENDLVSSLRKEIEKQINRQLKALTNNIFYYENNENSNVDIVGLDDQYLQWLLTQKELNLEITPKSYMLDRGSGIAHVKVINTYYGKREPFDLNEFHIEDLKLRSTNVKDVEEEIKSYVAEKFRFMDLKEFKDYEFENLNQNTIYESFKKKDSSKSLAITIKGISSNVSGKLSFMAKKEIKFNLLDYEWNNINLNIDVNYHSYGQKLLILETMKKEIQKQLQNQINTNFQTEIYDLSLDFKIIPNLENSEILEILFFNRPLTIKVIAYSFDLDGEFEIKIKNSHPSANKPLDLKIINLPELEIEINKNQSKEELWLLFENKVNQHINDNEVLNALNLNRNIDFDINVVFFETIFDNGVYTSFNDDTSELIFKYFYNTKNEIIYNEKVFKQIERIKIALIAKPDSNLLNGSKTEFNVKSKLISFDKEKEIEVNDKKTFKLSKKSLIWIIPLSVLGLGAISFGGWALYVRYGKKKIK